MSNYVLNASHAGVAAMSSAGIMARIATSAERQAATAKRLATYAVTGCGLPNCADCYPESTEPTAADLAQIETDLSSIYGAAVSAKRFDDYTNPDVNVIYW